MTKKETMDRKEKLIQATKEHLIEKGETNFSLRGIASRAGVNHGLVQYYFGGLEGLVKATIQSFAHGAIDNLKEKLKTSSNKEDVFKIIAEDFLGNENFTKLFIAISQLGQKMPEVRKFHQKMVISRRKELSKILDHDKELDIILLQAAVFGGVLLANLDPEFDRAKLMKHLFSKLDLADHKLNPQQD